MYLFSGLPPTRTRFDLGTVHYALGLCRALAWMRMAVPVSVGYLIAALPDSGYPKNYMHILHELLTSSQVNYFHRLATELHTCIHYNNLPSELLETGSHTAS